MQLRSPISRTGGKYFLRSWLTSMISEHVLYCEAFSGAAHLLFGKESSQVEVINDIGSHLVNFFRVIQEPEKRQMLINKLNYMPYSRSLWNEIRSQWKAGILPQGEIDRVSQWFYLNRSCFSGDQKRGGFAVPSITGRNPVRSFRNAIEGLDDIANVSGVFVLRIYLMANVSGVMTARTPFFTVIHRT